MQGVGWAAATPLPAALKKKKAQLARKGAKPSADAARKPSSRASGTHKHRGAAADAERLPPGWVRLESRSKPGVFFYAHPATKRTQVERPGVEGPLLQSVAKVDAGAAESLLSDEEPGPIDVESPAVEDQEAKKEAAARAAEEAEQKRREEDRRRAEEAAAEEEARQEAARNARARKLELVRETMQEKGEEKLEVDEDEQLVSKEELERWKQNEERIAREEAEAERQRLEEQKRLLEEERKRKEGEERKRREALELEEKRREEEKEEARRRRKEAAEMARREEEFERALASRLAAAPAAPGAPADAAQPAAAEGVVLSSSAVQARVAAPKESFPEPKEAVVEPCLDIFKDGQHVGRHVLGTTKQSWTLGRSPDQADIVMMHDSISRRHAAITRSGMFFFLSDLGSNHGTVLDGSRLETHKLVRLCQGSAIRFGASSRFYVYREPCLQLSGVGKLQFSRAPGPPLKQDRAGEATAVPAEGRADAESRSPSIASSSPSWTAKRTEPEKERKKEPESRQKEAQKRGLKKDQDEKPLLSRDAAARKSSVSSSRLSSSKSSARKDEAQMSSKYSKKHAPKGMKEVKSEPTKGNIKNKSDRYQKRELEKEKVIRDKGKHDVGEKGKARSRVPKEESEKEAENRPEQQLKKGRKKAREPSSSSCTKSSTEKREGEKAPAAGAAGAKAGKGRRKQPSTSSSASSSSSAKRAKKKAKDSSDLKADLGQPREEKKEVAQTKGAVEWI